MLDQILEVLDNNSEAAAKTGHCTVSRNWVSKSRPGLANHVMSDLVYQNLKQVGTPHYNEISKEFAREIQKNLGLPLIQEPFLELSTNHIDPQEAEKILRKDIPEWQKVWTSDDYTDMSWHSPTCRVIIGRPILKAPQGYRYPDWVLNALGGFSDCINPTIIVAAKTIANSFLQLLTEPKYLDDAKKEFKKRTGGGIGGIKWLTPLCDYPVPLDFTWPEYVNDKWCIPFKDNDLKNGLQSGMLMKC